MAQYTTRVSVEKQQLAYVCIWEHTDTDFTTPLIELLPDSAEDVTTSSEKQQQDGDKTLYYAGS